MTTSRRFEPYPAYKDSGVEWLGKLPSHWRVTKMWDVTTAMSGATPTKDNARYWDGGIPWVSPKDMKRRFIDSSEDTVSAEAVAETGLKLVSPPVVLVVVRGMILAHSFPVGITKVAVTINQDMKALRLRDDVDPEFFGYWLEGLGCDLLAVLVDEAAHGTKAIRMDTWRVTPVGIAPKNEQRTVVAFLDRETAKIDALVAKEERLIELLHERRTALISKVVTMGLGASVPTKDSSVETIGEIPPHWNVKRLWHLTPSQRRIMYGIVLPGPNVDEGVPIVKGGNVSPEGLRLAQLSRTTFDIEAGYARSRLKGGDLVYAIRGSIGEVAVVPDELEGANLTQDAARVAYTGASHGKWLLYALRSSGVFAQLEAGALGATIRGINIRDLKRALLPVPPKSEQVAIADFLDEKSDEIDRLLSKVHHAIERLREFRAALISAAVTGKIDVREEVT